MLFDLLALALFVYLVRGLRDTYLVKKNNIPTNNNNNNNNKKNNNNLKTQQEQQGEQLQYIFGGLVACLVLPMVYRYMFSGGGVDDFGMGGNVLTVFVENPSSVVGVGKLFKDSTPEKEYVYGLVDLTGDKQVTYGDVKRLCISLIRSLKNTGTKGIVFATIHHADQVYGELNFAVDEAVEELKSVVSFPMVAIHGFGDFSLENQLKNAANDCFADFKSCKRILEKQDDLLENKMIQRAIQKFKQSISVNKNDNDGGSSCECKIDDENENNNNNNNNIPKQQQQQQLHSQHYDDDDDDNHVVDDHEGPSFLKLFLLWLTKLFGFVYPFHQTYQSLLGGKEEYVGGWRAYWTIYALLCFVEDALFINLVLLMPIYLLAKVFFIVWCIWPNPTNSLTAYNTCVHSVYDIIKSSGMKTSNGLKED